MNTSIFDSIFDDGDTNTSLQNEVLDKFIFSGIFGIQPDYGDIQIGMIKRIVPFSFNLLSDPSIQALKRNLDELGVTDAIPETYQRRLKKNIERGLVNPDGGSFTPKGQEIARNYLMSKGIPADIAHKKSITATSLKIDAERGKKATPVKALKFAFGYRLDEMGYANKQ